MTKNKRSPYRAMQIWPFRTGEVDVSCGDCGWIDAGGKDIDEAKRSFREHRKRMH